MKREESFYEDYGEEWAQPLRKAFEEKCSNEKVRYYQNILPDSLQINTLVDFGCGQGTVLNNMGDVLKIPYRIGVDISSSMLATARETFPECSFVQGSLDDLNSLKIKPPSLLMFNDVLEHFPDPEKYLKQAAALFDYIAIQVPVEKTLLVAFMSHLHLKKPQSRLYNTEGHLHEFSTRNVLKILTESGLQISSWRLFAPPKEITFHPYLLDRMKQKRGLVNKMKSFIYSCLSKLPYTPVCTLLTLKTGSTFVSFCKTERDSSEISNV